MEQHIDAKGLTCPLPVVAATKALATLGEGDVVTVAVDNITAVQNLSKLAEQKKCIFASETLAADNHLVTLTLTENATATVPLAGQGARVVVLASDKMGEGDEILGRILLKGFIYALTEQDTPPTTVLLYNRGAFLSVEGAETLADLQLLAAEGVEVLTCGTCLNHYGLTEKLAVGSVTNMYVIAEKQMTATLVIKP